MNTELEFLYSGLKALEGRSHIEPVQLYPGAELFHLSLAEDSLIMRHKPLGHILQLNYCKAGQAVWTMGSKNHLCLNHGNFSLHPMDACADSRIIFPAKAYQGLALCLDLREMTAHPPEPLQARDIAALEEKFCGDGAPASWTGNEQTESIFSGYYDHPESLRLSYQRVKTLELILYLTEIDFTPQAQMAEYQTEQIEIVREIHDQLLQHMERRITIEELSRQYLINPTTLKAAFKSVYGTSLAAHIKEHRMEQAAKLLKETDMSIAEISQAVGYDSQSRFTAAFKAFFRVLPREYRKHL